MSQPLLRRALFDWWVRPFEELRSRLRNLRSAAQTQVDEIHRLLAERETCLRHAQGVAPEDVVRDSPATTPELDLRVRSAVIRDGSSGAASIRQEMAEMVSLLGLHRQLDRSSERAYEVVAAAERLLSLVRGDGWIFAHRDILAPGGDLLATIDGYRQRLDDAHTDLLQKATYLEGAVARHIKRYEVVKYVFVLLLLVGPLIGLWSGYQHADRPQGEPIPTRYVPHEVVQTLDLLSDGQQLLDEGGVVVRRPWGADSPDARLSLIQAAVESDLTWAAELCRRTSRAGSPGLEQHCREVLVGLRATSVDLEAIRATVVRQAALQRRVVRQATPHAAPGGSPREGTP